MSDKPVLIHGDCLEEMQKLERGSVDLVLTDPPYGTTHCNWDSVIPFDCMWVEIMRLSSGMILLFGNEPFSSLLRISCKKNYKYDLIWKKSPMSGHLNSKKMPMSDFENIMVFSFGGSFYYPIMLKGKPYAVKSGYMSDNYSSQKETVTINSGFRYPGRVVEFKKDRPIFHSTQKPVALLEYLIKTYTKPGETVLDFTMGSGSTGVACINTGRKFIGIEKDDEYFEIAKNRIEDAISKQTERLFA